MLPIEIFDDILKCSFAMNRDLKLGFVSVEFYNQYRPFMKMMKSCKLKYKDHSNLIAASRFFGAFMLEDSTPTQITCALNMRQGIGKVIRPLDLISWVTKGKEFPFVVFRSIISNGHVYLAHVMLNLFPYASSYALAVAVSDGQLEIIKLLQDRNYDIREQDNFAIKEATKKGHADIVKHLLIDSGVCPSVLAVMAAEFGSLEVLVFLMQDYRVENGLKHALFAACKEGRIQIVLVLLQDSRVDPSVHSNFAFRLACRHGRFEVVKKLLEDPRVDPSDRNQEALNNAAELGHLNILKLLLQHPNIDPGFDNSKALWYAVGAKYYHVVKTLMLDPRVDPSSNNNIALEIAVLGGSNDIVNLLLTDRRVMPSPKAIRIAKRTAPRNVLNKLKARRTLFNRLRVEIEKVISKMKINR